jgi:hypothetical protein
VGPLRAVGMRAAGTRAVHPRPMAMPVVAMPVVAMLVVGTRAVGTRALVTRAPALPLAAGSAAARNRPVRHTRWQLVRTRAPKKRRALPAPTTRSAEHTAARMEGCRHPEKTVAERTVAAAEPRGCHPD